MATRSLCFTLAALAALIGLALCEPVLKDGMVVLCDVEDARTLQRLGSSLTATPRASQSLEAAISWKPQIVTSYLPYAAR